MKRAAVNAVENKDYLSMMCSPDFEKQMSMPAGGGGSDNDLMEEAEGYLVPTTSGPPTSEEGYLLPKELQRKRSSVDESGYLIPSLHNSVKEPLKEEAEEEEAIPMLEIRGNGSTLNGSTPPADITIAVS